MNQGNITACVILSTQLIATSADQQNDQCGITMVLIISTHDNKSTDPERRHYYMHLSHTLQSQHETCNNMLLVITCDRS